MVCSGGSSVVEVVGPSQFGFDFTMPLTAILDDLMCTGEETNLFDCPHPGATVENCGPPFSDANLICGTSGIYLVWVLLKGAFLIKTTTTGVYLIIFATWPI